MSQTRTHWVKIADGFHKVTLLANGSAEVDGKPVPVDIRVLAAGMASILLSLPDGSVHSFHCIAEYGEAPAVVINGQRITYALGDRRALQASTVALSETGPRPLKSPMPGRIIRVLVAEGDTVTAGQGCVVIEAMKMQNELKAPRAGTVARLFAGIGKTVASGDTLLVIE